MQDKILNFKQHVSELAANPNFVHHQWFVQWHLEIVDKIAHELMAKYPNADSDLVEVMVWLHDYGKIIDYDNQYDQALLDVGYEKLRELGFADDFATRARDYIALQDKSQATDLHASPIEVQIIASADGCSHMVGPFMPLWWYENANKPFAELMADNRKKLDKDWDHKIVLPEARQIFEQHHNVLLQQTGELPASFFGETES